MDLECYEYQRRHAFREYEFYSEGPKGRIRKIVRFRPFSINGFPCYNLGFGDWNERLDEVEYTIVSNNGDWPKVLATVAQILISFTTHYPDVIVHIRGIDESRTRLYQMGINKTWDKIKGLFDVYGYTGVKWEPFQKNASYHAFLVQPIEYLILQEQNEYYMPSSPKKSSKKKMHHKEPIEFIIMEPVTDPIEMKKMEAARESFETAGFPREFFERNPVRKKQ